MCVCVCVLHSVQFSDDTDSDHLVKRTASQQTLLWKIGKIDKVEGNYLAKILAI